jgi:hypothetical protein
MDVEKCTEAKRQFDKRRKDEKAPSIILRGDDGCGKSREYTYVQV